MNQATTDETIEIRLTPTYAWMAMGFGVLFFLLGVLFMIPLMPRHNYLLGLAVMVTSALVFFAGRWWARNLPVCVRIGPQGLEFVGNKITYLLSDISEVGVHRLYLGKWRTFFCLRLRPGCAEKYKGHSGGIMQTAVSAIIGEWDIIVTDELWVMGAEELKSQVDRRIEKNRCDTPNAVGAG